MGYLSVRHIIKGFERNDILDNMHISYSANERFLVDLEICFHLTLT